MQARREQKAAEDSQRNLVIKLGPAPQTDFRGGRHQHQGPVQPPLQRAQERSLVPAAAGRRVHRSNRGGRQTEEGPVVSCEIPARRTLLRRDWCPAQRSPLSIKEARPSNSKAVLAIGFRAQPQDPRGPDPGCVHSRPGTA